MIIAIKRGAAKEEIRTFAAFLEKQGVGVHFSEGASQTVLGRCRKPILLKRGLASTITELLMAAEYLMAGGNDRIVLCERGIRTFDSFTRNTLDLSAVPALKRQSHLPVIVDPSYATGLSWMVPAMAKAAVAAGADGLIIEVHNNPEEALCDGEQSITPGAFTSLMETLRKYAGLEGKKL
jgi:3-deoxy-7-phosphoheptulonate synthase